MYDMIRYFKVFDGTEIEYADLGGNGPVLLFIPGYSLATDLVLPFLSRFRDRFRCVTLTLRGFGGTTPAAPGLPGQRREKPTERQVSAWRKRTFLHINCSGLL